MTETDLEHIEIPSSTAPRVSIVIPSAAKPDLLFACLRSLALCAPATIAFETIVVLNASDAGTAARLGRAVPGVQFLWSSANLGMAGSANRGRNHGRGEFIVTLHDDAEVEPGWLEALVETADAHPEAGAVGGKVLNFDGSLQSAGMILWNNGSTSSPWPGQAPSPDSFGRLRAVDYCGSSSLLVRTSAWDAVGGMDERLYPAYYVDVDLSMAMRRLGFVVLCQPKSRIRHHRGASTGRRFREFAALRNHGIFIQKWAADLTDFEPPAPDSPEAIERAILRAGKRSGGGRGAPSRPLNPKVDFDPERQTELHLEKRRELQKAYYAYLAEVLGRHKPLVPLVPVAARKPRWRRLLRRIIGA